MVNIESDLFSRLTKAKSLPHPTARNFDKDKWLDAARKAGVLSTRDQQLLEAALHFGNEIRALRMTYESRLFGSSDRRTGIILSIAMANYNFLTLTKLANNNVKKERRKKDGPISIGSIARQPISGPYPGNISTADNSVATIVDTLPHCIERALRLRYEAWVREELERCIAENSLLPNARCAKDGTPRREEKGEQIDLLIRLGNLLIVGETKCFLAPVESMEHFNYLSRLNDAGEQVVRKAKWILENLDVAAELLNLSSTEVKQLRPVPIVVINQGSGFGLIAGGARVVDFHYLRLYLTDGEYATGTAFNFAEKRAASQFHVLYKSESEAEARFEETMANPPTIVRFIKSAMWHTTKFPMSNGENLEIAVCNFNDHKDQDARNLVSSVSP